VAEVAEHRLLYPGIARGYRDRRDTILGVDCVDIISEGSLRFDENGQGWATPTIVRVSANDLLAQRERLLDEAFGPLSILVEYDSEDELALLADQVFKGNLTGTVHAAAGEDTAPLRALIYWLAQHSGRVLFGGWPTGVAVTPAMQHGGPWPATTNDSGTSVGTAAITRFLRPVSNRARRTSCSRCPCATITRGGFFSTAAQPVSPTHGELPPDSLFTPPLTAVSTVV